MRLDHITVIGGDLLLQIFDFRTGEFDYFAGFNAHHVVVMLTAVQFINGLPALEVVLFDQTGGLELGQDPVHRGKTDIVTVGQKPSVKVFGAQMMDAIGSEDLQDPDARMGDFQAQFLQIAALVRHGVATFPAVSGRKLVYH